MHITTTAIRALYDSETDELVSKNMISKQHQDSVLWLNGHSGAMSKKYYLKKKQVNAVKDGRYVMDLLLNNGGVDDEVALDDVDGNQHFDRLEGRADDCADDLVGIFDLDNNFIQSSEVEHEQYEFGDYGFDENHCIHSLLHKDKSQEYSYFSHDDMIRRTDSKEIPKATTTLRQSIGYAFAEEIDAKSNRSVSDRVRYGYEKNDACAEQIYAKSIVGSRCGYDNFRGRENYDNNRPAFSRSSNERADFCHDDFRRQTVDNNDRISDRYYDKIDPACAQEFEVLTPLPLPRLHGSSTVRLPKDWNNDKKASTLCRSVSDREKNDAFVQEIEAKSSRCRYDNFRGRGNYDNNRSLARSSKERADFCHDDLFRQAVDNNDRMRDRYYDKMDTEDVEVLRPLPLRPHGSATLSVPKEAYVNWSQKEIEYTQMAYDLIYPQLPVDQQRFICREILNYIREDPRALEIFHPSHLECSGKFRHVIRAYVQK